MRGALLLAWVTGEGIIIWQSVKKEHHPPMPGRLLGATALFAILGVVAEFGPQAAGVATAAAWAFDVAALWQVLPEGLGVSKTAKTTAAKTTTTKAKAA